MALGGLAKLGHLAGGVAPGVASLGQTYFNIAQTRLQLGLQERQLKQQRDMAMMNTVVNYANVLARAGVTDERLIQVLQPLAELTDGVIDVSKLDFEERKPRELIQTVQKLWTALNKKEINLQQLQQEFSTLMLEWPKQQKYIEQQIGLAATKQKELETFQADIRKGLIGGEIQPTEEAMEYTGLGGLQMAPRKWVPTTKEEALELRKSGAPLTQIQIGREERAADKYSIQRGITISEMRLNLLQRQGDKKYFDTYASEYNEKNTRNELVYWSTKGFDKSQIIKLPPNITKEQVFEAMRDDRLDPSNPDHIETALKALGLI